MLLARHDDDDDDDEPDSLHCSYKTDFFDYYESTVFSTECFLTNETNLFIYGIMCAL